jgi:hypothetical protein
MVTKLSYHALASAADVANEPKFSRGMKQFNSMNLSPFICRTFKQFTHDPFPFPYWFTTTIELEQCSTFAESSHPCIGLVAFLGQRNDSATHFHYEHESKSIVSVNETARKCVLRKQAWSVGLLCLDGFVAIETFRRGNGRRPRD